MNKMSIKLKAAFHEFFNSLGYNFVKLSEDFIHEQWSSPIELIYKTYKEYIMINVPLTEVRYLSFHGHKAGYDSSSPFIKTLKQYIDGQAKNYQESYLYSFYEAYQPKSIAEYLHLDQAENSVLNELPASGAFFPWQNRNPKQRVAARVAEIEKDNKEHKSKLNTYHGDSFYGPVSAEKGELEYNRLIKTYNSIAANGFKVDLKGMNNIGAMIMANDNEYRYLINPGQHRVAALSALNYKEITLQVNKNLIIRRTEAKQWPGVINRYFTEAEALQVFDRVFAGQVPKLTADLIEQTP